jgi:hypothetical protein
VGDHAEGELRTESELTVLIADAFSATPSARHRLPEKVEGHLAAEYFTAPTFMPPTSRSHPLLVGTVDGVLGIDLRDGAARLRLATTPDFGFVARRGLIYLPRTATLVVAFNTHPNLRVIAYRRDGRSRFRKLRELASYSEGNHAGAALSPSGRLLAVGVQEDVGFHPVEAGADARLGAMLVYETAGLTKVGKFEVRASIDRDFGRRELSPGDGRCVPHGGGPHIPARYEPLGMMSNPAFLDDRWAVFGMPGGEVRLLDVETGQVEAISDGPRVVVQRLDCAPAKRRIAAGFDDGSIRVWSI